MLQGWIFDFDDFVLESFAWVQLLREVALRTASCADADVNDLADGAPGNPSFKVARNGGIIDGE